jgi:hypothetical protein
MVGHERVGNVETLEVLDCRCLSYAIPVSIWYFL